MQRMLRVERESRSVTDKVPPRQVFITASRQLKAKTEEKFRGAYSLESWGGKEPGPLPHSFDQLRQEDFPLFLSFEELLTLIDGSLKKPFFPRNPDGSLCDTMVSAGRGTARDSMREEVSYSVFLRHYWGHNNHKIPPSAVYQEILSVIKGTSFADQLGTNAMERGRALTLEEYEKMPKKRCLFDCADGTDKLPGRALVFKLYQKYEETKRTRNNTTARKAYDCCDVGFHLLRALQNKEHKGLPGITHLYVDEVQDFLLQHLELLMLCCEDKNGLVFCGDTCQTIARGVEFRFADLMSLFHRLKQDSREHQLPHQIDQLTVNYRTHQQILSLANEIVDLLAGSFPRSIDALKNECARFSGQKPQHFTTMDYTELAELLGLFSGHEGSTGFGFGAEQLVIVRDQESKHKLLQEAPEFKNAQVLTILESKGLEYEDVFIINFL